MFPGVWSAFRQGEEKIHAECPVNEEKAHMWCVFVCVTHAQVYIYIHVCVYVRQRIWILAFTVKSRYCSTRQIFWQRVWNLLFTLLLQGRLEGLPPHPS